MKRKTKKIIEGVLIWTVTLLTGLAVAGISFGLFDTLTRTQIRIMFFADIIILLLIGAIAYLIYDTKMRRTERQTELHERHNKRIEQNKVEMAEINNIISFSNYAA